MLKVNLPQTMGPYARIAPRSGLAVKHGIDVFAGVVDWDYRGELAVIPHNHGTQQFDVQLYGRLAQLVLDNISMVRCWEIGNLTTTERGESGFGGTGTAKLNTSYEEDLKGNNWRGAL